MSVPKWINELSIIAIHVKKRGDYLTVDPDDFLALLKLVKEMGEDLEIIAKAHDCDADFDGVDASHSEDCTHCLAASVVEGLQRGPVTAEGEKR